MESSLCWKHLSGCVISRIFPVLFFLLLIPYAFFFFLTLSHAQAPTHTHFCISCTHPQCWYTVFLLCLMKVQSFTCPCSEFITPNLHFLVTSHEFGVVQPHPFLPSLLNLPCSLVSHRCVCWRVHCPKAAQAFPADQWGEGERSRRGNLRVFSCQFHKPSEYPALELPPGDEFRLNHAWKFPGNTATAQLSHFTGATPGIPRDNSSAGKVIKM